MDEMLNRELGPKFLLTGDLNRLAQWLRLLGYDTVVTKSVSLAEQIRLVARQHRILLTRSYRVARDKRRFERIRIFSGQHLEQLQELLPLLHPEEDAFFSRCLCCNRKLHPIAKEKVRGLVPERSYEAFDAFQVCRFCGRVYWQGSHWEAMRKTIQSLL